jgi:hypothetical protein
LKPSGTDVGYERDADGNAATKADPGREPCERELRCGRHERRQQRCRTEYDEAPKEHGFAPVTVAEPATKQRADEHSDVASRQGGGESRWRLVPCIHKLGHDVADHGQVVALEDEYEPTD